LQITPFDLSLISNSLLSVLQKCFNGFCKNGVVLADTVNDILQMMGLRVAKQALADIIAEVDEDGV
jgi:Ca2+-binding EF-hand superfamily protein